MSTTSGPTAAELAARLAELSPAVLAEPGRVRGELRELLAQTRQQGAAEAEVQALLELSRCDFYQGRYEDMHALAEQALKCSRRRGFTVLETRALNSLGLSALRQRHLPQAMEHFMAALRLAAHADEVSAAITLGNVALVYVQIDRYDTALKLQSHVRAVMQGADQPVYLAFALSNLLGSHRRLGHHAAVLDLAAQAIVLCRAHGIARFECTTHVALGRTLMDLGRLEAARRTATAGLRVARWAQDRESMAALRLLEGEALLAQRLTAEATTSLNEALRLSTAVGLALQLEVHEAMAHLHEARGELGRAQHHHDAVRTLRAGLPTPATVPPHLALPAGPFGPYTWAPELAALVDSLPPPPPLPDPAVSRDGLTGHLDRGALQGALRRQLDLLGPEDLLGVLFLGVDGMRAVNERFGQDVGDRLLGEVGRRLQATLRAGDVIGRLGSDEFMVILPYLAQTDDLGLVTERVLEAIRVPFVTAGQEISVSVSVGGAVAPQDGTGVDELLSHADLALHQAKRAGRGGAHLYEAALSADEQRRRVLRYDLRTALRYDELRLHYQPVHALPGLDLTGYEALLRWQHPRLGLLRPTQFVPLAEESRLILDLGDWALCEAARQAARWRFPERNLSMAVNISQLQFAQPDFVSGVKAALRGAGLDGRHLLLELTESALHPDAARTDAHLAALADLGVRVAVDDFGTGFSSLRLLQTHRFDVLKIDRGFLQDLQAEGETRERAVTLLEMTVELARRLGLRVIAEGVEFPEQIELLSALGCDGVQGYLLGTPIAPEAFEPR
jgi:diguanylate cyclase (GGDEF)-like protein